jgi:hypothetical protein
VFFFEEKNQKTLVVGVSDAIDCMVAQVRAVDLQAEVSGTCPQRGSGQSPWTVSDPARQDCQNMHSWKYQQLMFVFQNICDTGTAQNNKVKIS